MKFGQKYNVYVETEARHLLGPGCPYVGFKQYKKLLNKCPHHHAKALANTSGTATTSYGGVTIMECSDDDGETPTSTNMDRCGDANAETGATVSIADGVLSKSYCAQCDADFFSELDKEVAAVVKCFNSRAKELLSFHLASGIRKHLLRLRKRIAGGGERGSMIQIGNTLVSYGCMNALAIRKILKKYDKVHLSDNGKAYKSRLQVKRVELLQSPLLIELSALAVNLMDIQATRALALDRAVYSTCSFDNGRQVISCVVPDGMKLDFDLTCPVCLDTVFDPVALGCGHIFCNSCACAAGKVSTYIGVTSAKRSSKCPLCRLAAVYTDAVSMGELFQLVNNRCQENYARRLPEERELRVRDAKEHYEKLFR